MFDALQWSELQDWNEYAKIFVGVITRVTPPFIVPLYLNAVGDRPLNEKIGTALVAAASFAVLMIFFTFFGQALLQGLGITMSAFRIAGGVLLFLLAVDMIQGGEAKAYATNNAHKNWIAAGIVPLGTPILAGPGSISTIVIFSDMSGGLTHKFMVVAVLLAVTAYIAITLALAATTKKLFGPLFTTVLNRVMGLVVLAIAVEFILDGLSAHFPALHS